ncbi:MAG: hypothetical protein ABL887_07740 [Nitrosomonas sp.]
MTLTFQQQTSILQLILAMFNTSPGAVNLKVLGSKLINDQSLVNLAQSLAESALFFGKDYAALSAAEFAATFVDDLFGDRVSTIDKTLIFDFIANQIAIGVNQSELISELTGAFSSISPSDPNWGKAALHYRARNATKIVDHLLVDTFVPADKAIVTDHIVTQMAAGKTFGAMIVWAINTLDRADHSNLVWGRAAALFKNRIEVSKYYSIDKASTAIDLIALQQILSRVTVDAGSIGTAKAAIDKLINLNNCLLDTDNKDFQLNTVFESKKRGLLSMSRRISMAT